MSIVFTRLPKWSMKQTTVTNLHWVSDSFTSKVMIMMVIILPVIIIKITRIHWPWTSGLESWFCNIKLNELAGDLISLSFVSSSAKERLI